VIGNAIESDMKKYTHIISCLALCVVASAAIAHDHFKQKYTVLQQEAIDLYIAGKTDQAHEKADAIFRLVDFAAAQGDAWGQYRLGVSYKDGSLGNQVNYAKAADYFALAAKQGYPNAQRDLGALYETGQGVLQDYVIAHMWYNIATSNGAEKAGRMRDGLAMGLNENQLLEARELASQCKTSGYTDCTKKSKSILDFFR